MQVRLDGAFDDLEKIRDLPIVVERQDIAPLRHRRRSQRGYEDPATFLIRSEGEPALLLGVVMREAGTGSISARSLRGGSRGHHRRSCRSACR